MGRTRTLPPPARIGGTAVVVGGSVAGLCAARVLSERFDHVLVVDRDDLPDDARWRRQVPQGRHPHLLLTAGARLLESWFPGIVDELEAAGAIDVDLCGDVHWHQGGGAWRRPASTLHGPAMSRPLLEHAIRQRVGRLPGVELRAGTVVEGLEADASRTRVTGVRLAGGDVVLTGLVVDASGRQARSLAWLHDLGYDGPRTSVVEIDTRYVTQLYRRTDRPARTWKGAAVIDVPAAKRLAVVLPVEGDRWLVTFAGINGTAAPTDLAALLHEARTFDDPVVAEVMEASEPIGDPVTHRFPANQRRHVERLRRFPLGWVLLGDAVCSYNPIYGQGMTVAAQQAAALAEQLDRAGAVDRDFARRYFRAAGRTVAVPWSLAVGGDFAYDGTTGKRPPGTAVSNRYMDRVTVAAQHDDEVVVRVNEVGALVRRPEALLAPAFVVRVLRAARRGPVDGGTSHGGGPEARPHGRRRRPGRHRRSAAPAPPAR